MAYQYDIQTNNFLNLLRSGAFNESKPIGIMSEYKWEQLVSLAWWHQLTPILAKGVEHYYYDDQLNIPESQIETIKTQLSAFPTIGFSDMYVFERLHMKNKTLEERLQQIVRKEYGDMEKSYETMQLMAIIITNVESMLNCKSYLRGVIDLGRYLRLDGDKVDFVKLEKWLSQVNMSRMAELQGNLLIEGFGFSKEELPFVSKVNDKTYKWLERSLMRREYSHSTKPNGITPGNDFALSSPSTAFHTIRHALSFWRLASREVRSTIFQGIVRGLAEIDE